MNIPLRLPLYFSARALCGVAKWCAGIKPAISGHDEMVARARETRTVSLVHFYM